MTWVELEKSFHRAFLQSFSWNKAILVFPALVLCGIVVVFCRALRFGASEWMSLGLNFLPILLCSCALLSVGVLVIRMYLYEQKGLKITWKKLFIGSLSAIMGTSYLSIPLIVLYILLWMILGVFFLMKEIPGVGHVVNTLFVFIPFLLIFCMGLLCIISVALLFFVAPAAAKFSLKRMQVAKIARSLVEKRFLTRLAFFLTALLPLGALTALLMGAGMFTQISFSYEEKSWTLALQWFFLIFPLAAMLTPFVIFFFQFAVEAENASEA